MNKNISFNELKNLSKSDPFYCELNSNLQYIGPVNPIEEDDYSFLFSNFLIISCPTSLIYLKFSSDFSTSYPISLYSYKNSLDEMKNNSNYYIFLPIKINTCSIGQIYNINSSYCEVCPKGYYSIIDQTTQCRPCLPNTVCEGSDTLLLNPNYWNEPGFLENIYHCNFFVGNCLGGATSQCNDGYEGKLCSQCIRFIGTSQYYQDYLGNCNECPIQYLIITIYLVLITFGYLAVHFILMIFTSEGKYSEDQKFIVKIIVNIWHLNVYTRDEYNDLTLEDYESTNFFKNIKFFWKIDYLFIPFECLYTTNESQNIDKNAFIDTIFIIMVAYLFMSFYFIRLKYKRVNIKKISSHFMVIFYVIFPSLIKLISEDLAYQNINGQLVLHNNNQYTLNDVAHSYTFYLFLLPNLATYIGILYYQNIYIQLKERKGKNLKIIEIVNCGISKNNVIFEGLNFLTMLFFFIIGILDIDPTIKNPIILMVFFYRFVIEFLICKFNKPIYTSINFIFKIIFIIDFIVLFYATLKLPFKAIQICLIIEMISICILILYFIAILKKYMVILKRFFRYKKSIKKYRKNDVLPRMLKYGDDIKVYAYNHKNFNF